MNNYSYLTVFFLFINSFIFSQSTVKHIVAKGESIYSIAKKYNIKEAAIYENNPNLKGQVLKFNTIIQIPNKQGAEVEKDLTLVEKHTVAQGETLFKISKKYRIKVQELERLNPSIVTKLPIGYVLILKEESPIVVAIESNNVVEDQIVEEVIINKPTDVELLIESASKNIGTRYRSGGSGEKGFDCSGLMVNTFKEINMNLPRSSRQQAKIGTKVDPSEAKIGDLIFFATNRIGTISHVGLITEIIADEIKFIHSSTSLGVIISSIKEKYYSKRFVQINRIF